MESCRNFKGSLRFDLTLDFTAWPVDSKLNCDSSPQSSAVKSEALHDDQLNVSGCYHVHLIAGSNIDQTKFTAPNVSL